MDLDLQEVYKCAAAKLNIQWSEVQAEVVRSRYNGKKLLKANKMGKRLMPFFLELVDELAVSWGSKPHQDKYPPSASSVLYCKGV